jgi:hypothetical protein
MGAGAFTTVEGRDALVGRVGGGARVPMGNALLVEVVLPGVRVALVGLLTAPVEAREALTGRGATIADARVVPLDARMEETGLGGENLLTSPVGACVFAEEAEEPRGWAEKDRWPVTRGAAVLLTGARVTTGLVTDVLRTVAGPTGVREAVVEALLAEAVLPRDRLRAPPLEDVAPPRADVAPPPCAEEGAVRVAETGACALPTRSADAGADVPCATVRAPVVACVTCDVDGGAGAGADGPNTATGRATLNTIPSSTACWAT